MKTTTNIQRAVFALVLAAFAAVFLSGCIIEPEHHGDWDHDHHEWHDHDR